MALKVNLEHLAQRVNLVQQVLWEEMVLRAPEECRERGDDLDHRVLLVDVVPMGLLDWQAQWVLLVCLVLLVFLGSLVQREKLVQQVHVALKVLKDKEVIPEHKDQLDHKAFQGHQEQMPQMVLKAQWDLLVLQVRLAFQAQLDLLDPKEVLAFLASVVQWEILEFMALRGKQVPKETLVLMVLRE